MNSDDHNENGKSEMGTSLTIILLVMVISTLLLLFANGFTCGLSTLLLGVIEALIWFRLEKTPKDKLILKGAIAGFIGGISYGIFASILIIILILISTNPPDFLLPVLLISVWLCSLILAPFEGFITGYISSKTRDRRIKSNIPQMQSTYVHENVPTVSNRDLNHLTLWSESESIARRLVSDNMFLLGTLQSTPGAAYFLGQLLNGKAFSYQVYHDRQSGKYRIDLQLH